MQYRSSFNITGWEPAEADKTNEIADIERARIRKTFAGDLEGSSVANALLYQTPAQSGGYAALERITGKIGDREGTFVVQRSGIRDAAGKGPAYGDVVPGSGTGGFEGVTGTMKVEEDASGKSSSFDLNFA